MTPIDPIERKLFLDGIYMRYGYDFREYSEASLSRRLSAIMSRERLTSLLPLLALLLADREKFQSLLPCLTISTTEFFRDPELFVQLREKVVPVLQTYPSINIWSAGCSTGEELYSLAVLLREEGLLSRSTIYATDINPAVLKTAREGIYSLESVQHFTRNYVRAGGKGTPSDYYVADYGMARFDPLLRANVVFAEHNLATDHVFKEMHLILCRNVMIYFDRPLQDRVFRLFLDSLSPRGFLAVGSKESIRFSTVAPYFESVSELATLQRLKAGVTTAQEGPP